MNEPDPGPITDPPALTVGDTVWNDANANGVQEAEEPGVAGVTVNLLDNNVVATTTTDSLGHYQFTASGSGSAYQVQVVVPAGYEVTAQYAGPEDQDSNIDATGYTEVFSLDSAGPGNNTLDAGLVGTAAATIGDRVWLDGDGNGVQDYGEAGMAGVDVVLYGAGGSYVATATTDANGL